MPLDEYLKLLDWTARWRTDRKRGVTPEGGSTDSRAAGVAGGYVVPAGRELRPLVPQRSRLPDFRFVHVPDDLERVERSFILASAANQN